MSQGAPDFRRYLGDGVYAHHDGHQVWLTTQEGMQIALEPGLPGKVVEFEAMVHRHYAEAASKQEGSPS